MWKQVFGLVLLGSTTQLFGQSTCCYVPDGQTVYSEICCPDECCPPTCPAPCNLFPVLVVDLQGGVRRDSLSFSVRGQNNIPDRYLRQKYTKIKSIVGAVNVWYQANRRLYLRGYADYAGITSGKQKQTFYDLNGDPALFYRQKAHSGYLYDFLGGLGWVFPCLPHWFTFAAAGGYSQDGQYIKSNHAKLTTPAGDQGHVPGRHSNLKVTWTGPWAGVDMAIRYQGLKVGGTFEYHWANFRATENQTAGGGCVNNCRTVNKLHSNGRGLVGVLSATQVCCENWRFGFVGRLQYWETTKGHYTEDGLRLPLNRVKWSSGSLVADLGYRF